MDLAYDVQCQDMYGRTLAYVTVDGQEVNTLMLERGFACLLHISPDGDSRLDEFKAIETAAKAANPACGAPVIRRGAQQTRSVCEGRR